MDFAELNKVGNRQKMISDVEQLRERVNRENRKIIKQRVAQDTAYWDVKEKLRQTETNHEKLQQKMAELQMQYATVSGIYQDELRFRPVTLNKLASTRKICDSLEDYSERLRGTLSCCKADQSSLIEANQKSGQVVRDLKDKQIHINENRRLVIDNLQEKIRLTTGYNFQQIQFFNSVKQRMESEIRETKTKLSDASNLNGELLSAGRELNRELEACRIDVHKKKDSINALQKDIKRLYKEFNSHAAERNNTILKQNEENKELTSNIEALQQALTNQEAFTNSVVNQNNGLQEKLADLENEVSKKDGCIAEIKETIQKAKVTNESLTIKITNMDQENQHLLREINQKNEILRIMELELQKLTRHLSTLDSEKCEAEAAVSHTVNVVKALDSRVLQMTAAGHDLEGKLQEVENKMEADREVMAKQIKQLTMALEDKERDVASTAGTISKLTGDVKHCLDVQTDLDASLQNVQRDMEVERQKMGERESQLIAKIGQLEVVTKVKENELRSKDEEFNKHITLIRDLRGDKDRLNLKIVAMQSKIDNLQKELTGPMSRALTAADHDDNDIMLTPHPPKMAQQHVRFSPLFNLFVSPRSEHRDRNVHPTNNNTIFNFLSDDSIMDDSIDDSQMRSASAAAKRKDKDHLLSKNKARRGGGSGGHNSKRSSS